MPFIRENLQQEQPQQGRPSATASWKERKEERKDWHGEETENIQFNMNSETVDGGSIQ